MTIKKPNYIYKFDDSNPTEEDIKNSFCELLNLFYEISLENFLEENKFKNKKEMKELKNQLENYHKKVSKNIKIELKNLKKW